MAEPLNLSVRGDDAVIVVTVCGDLTHENAARVRSVLLKCLSDQPGAILVDLSGMTVSAPIALTVFAAITRQAASWPGIPVLICAAQPAVAAILDRGGPARLVRHPTLAAARTGLVSRIQAPPLVVDDLLPVPGAARHARNMVTEACARWSLPHLTGPASLIVNELVANVIDHVGSMMTVRVSLRSRYLHISVRDGSAHMPGKEARPATSGLGLVASLATGWGCLSTGDGKVMWAVLTIEQEVP